jgi:hypothetical protein
MSDAEQVAVETVSIGMFESGGEEGSGFHVFNMAPNHYHRAEALQRTGAVDISCTLEKVVHGIMAADSDLYATLVVMQWLFQPKGTRRISEATIELRFDGVPGGGDIEVENISFLDTYSILPMTQEESVTVGGEGTVGVEQVASLGVTGKWYVKLAFVLPLYGCHMLPRLSMPHVGKEETDIVEKGEDGDQDDVARHHADGRQAPRQQPAAVPDRDVDAL